MAKNDYLKVLSALGLAHNQKYQDGEITYTFDKETCTLDLDVRLPGLLTPAEALDFRTKIINWAQLALKVQAVNLTLRQLQDPSDALLAAYYEYAFNKHTADSCFMSGLENFKRDCQDGKISFYINPSDIPNYQGMVDAIAETIYSLGIKATLAIIPSNFTPSVAENISKARERQSLEMQKDAVSAEQAAATAFTEPREQRLLKPRQMRARDPLKGKPTPLAEVPKLEAELLDYKNRTGTEEFLLRGVLAEKSIEEHTRRLDGKKFTLFKGLLTAEDGAIKLSKYLRDDGSDLAFYNKRLTPGATVLVYGRAEYNKYERDIVINVMEIGIDPHQIIEEERIVDDAPERRVELRAHTKMTDLDSVIDCQEYVASLAAAGYEALAVTDKDNIHIFPDFESECRKHKIKPIYGLDTPLIDLAALNPALTPGDCDLKTATFVVFDLETTGFSASFDEIIEIGAVKIEGGVITNHFSEYVNPHRKLSSLTMNLTNIRQASVDAADPLEKVLPRFLEYAKGAVLVAHNARFDYKFITEKIAKIGLPPQEFLVIDTLNLARFRYPDMKRFGLEHLCRRFEVVLAGHHRAINDAQALAEVWVNMLGELLNNKVTSYAQLNDYVSLARACDFAHPSYITLLVKNKTGLRHLYEIISASHTEFLGARGKINVPKEYLAARRDGLLIGSGAADGEIFELALNDRREALEAAAQFYDYLEIQPPENYRYLVEKQGDEAVAGYIEAALVRIIETGEKLGIPVVATGDLYQLAKNDTLYRHILVKAKRRGGGIHPFASLKAIPNQYFRTTGEMLDAFAFLPEAVARKIVIDNSRAIAAEIADFSLFPDGLQIPRDDFLKEQGVPSFKAGIKELASAKVHALYGAELPKYVQERFDTELQMIIDGGYASIYYISYLLVKKSYDDGYVVGSRGSVGSSFIAYLLDITEVNPLYPHYLCPECQFSVFQFGLEDRKKYIVPEKGAGLLAELAKVETGYDLPAALCPECGAALDRCGVNIPFEIFMGYGGTKVPDIDLNFSGEYQALAHDYCRDLFGHDNSLRSGTITKASDKTTFGYVKGYMEEMQISWRQAEINQVVKKVVDSKLTTGQHPGGIVIIPDYMEYNDIVPIQYPSDEAGPWRTTHYDYHKFEKNLLKLDMLGHDDPTMIRFLMNYVEAAPEAFPFAKVEEIPLTDPQVLALFSGLAPLGVDSAALGGEEVGTNGIPEFGTRFVKDMLAVIKPASFSELVRVSGLSHGTMVWLGNAADLFLGRNPDYPNLKLPLSELVCSRGDIMTQLTSKGMPSRDAYNIMEQVRKGRGVSLDNEQKMLNHGIPKWYIASCKAIQYLFPKAHACAYVIMALRIAWFKVYRPLYYYSAYFSLRAKEFDYETMIGGAEKIRAKIKKLTELLAKSRSKPKEENLLTTLQVALEMTARGYSFEPIDLFTADSAEFKMLPDGKSLMMPLKSLDGLGTETARAFCTAREEGLITSLAAIKRHRLLNKTLLARMEELGIFENLPKSDQQSLFDFETM